MGSIIVLSVIVTSWGADLNYIDYKDYVYYRAMVLEAQSLELSPIIEYSEEKGIDESSTLSMIFNFDNGVKTIRTILEKELKPLLENLQKVVDLQIRI